MNTYLTIALIIYLTGSVTSAAIFIYRAVRMFRKKEEPLRVYIEDLIIFSLIAGLFSFWGVYVIIKTEMDNRDYYMDIIEKG